jgi:hypothetical protein
MKRIILPSAVFVILSFTSCSKERIKGEGSTITQQRNLTGFNAVHSSGSSKVYITQGAQFSVSVTGYENLLAYYETRVVNNELRLGYKNNVSIKNDNIEVRVTMPVLSSLGISGSGETRTTGNFPSVSQFDAYISGSGNIHFSDGSAGLLRTSLSGSGNIYALGMMADKAETTTSGSGNTELSVASHLTVKISGSGNVYYRGNPLIVTNISGSGAVIPK